MNKLKSLSLLLGALLLISATGCDLGLDRKADLSALDTDAFAVVDREDAIANVEDATLFGNVRSILNSGQQAKWDEWVAGLKGPCSGN